MIRMLIWSSNFTLKSLSLLVSVDSILQDLQALQRGMEGTKREFSVEKDNLVLQRFLNTNVELLNGLIADGKTAQVGFNYQNQNRKLSRFVSVDVRNRKYLSVHGWSWPDIFTFFCRMLMTQLWSTSEKTQKQRRPRCSSLFLSDSSKRTRSDNRQLLRWYAPRAFTLHLQPSVTVYNLTSETLFLCLPASRAGHRAEKQATRGSFNSS